MVNKFRKKSQPLVSVCLPTYNGAQFLAEALNSISKQTYKNIELIVSDDDSKDATLKIVKEFKGNVDFPCVVYNHIPNGISENWNNTIKKAAGKYIKFIFQDDVLNPTCIAKMVEVLELDSDIGLVTSKRSIISSENNRFTQGFIANFKDLQINIPILNETITIIEGKELLGSSYFKMKPINIIGEPTAVMFRKDVILSIGFFNTQMFQLVDYEYSLRLFKKYKIAFIKEELVQFRLHGSQASFVNNQNNINDKEFFYKLLYKDYFFFLHKNFKWALIKRFHWSFKVYRFLKSLIKNKK